MKPSVFRPCFLACLALFLAPWSQTGQAQQPATASLPGFEVATIKPSQPGSPNFRIGVSDGNFVTINQTLLQIIKFAYNTNFGSDDQVSGGPPWINSAKFDIQTKNEEAVAQQISKLKGAEWSAAIQHQVQLLLAQRFHLTVHHETRDLPVYELVLAKGGATMKRDDGTPGAAPHSTGININKGKIEGTECTPELLANVLGRQPEVGHLVLDKTGLPGHYDFSLRWTPLLPDGGSPDDASGPSLTTALTEQLGLKLQKTKAPMDVIVIDQVEMPTAN